MNEKMKILIAYDGSDCADAASQSAAGGCDKPAGPCSDTSRMRSRVIGFALMLNSPLSSRTAACESGARK